MSTSPEQVTSFSSFNIRILACRHVPHLAMLDQITGQLIRASPANQCAINAAGPVNWSI